MSRDTTPRRPIYSNTRTDDPNACMSCGRFNDTIQQATTTKGHTVRLCSACMGTARSLGHLRNHAEYDANVRAIRSLDMGQSVTLEGDGLTLDRTLDSTTRHPVTIVGDNDAA